MPHPLVLQLRFARSEFRRGLEGLSEENAGKRLLPMNCVSWNIGHLAWQEQRYWLTWIQGKTPLPDLNEKFCYSCPGFSPPLAEIWTVWHTITNLVDPFLDTLTTADLVHFMSDNGLPTIYSVGSLMQRVIYHYWYHTGENSAIRQMLGHTNLPDFVGNIDEEAPYKAH